MKLLFQKIEKPNLILKANIFERENKNAYLHIQSKYGLHFKFDVNRGKIDWNFLNSWEEDEYILVAVYITSGGCSKPGHTRSAKTYEENDFWYIGMICPIVKGANECGLSSLYYGIREYKKGIKNAIYERFRKDCGFEKHEPLSFMQMKKAAQYFRDLLDFNFTLEIYSYGVLFPTLVLRDPFNTEKEYSNSAACKDKNEPVIRIYYKGCDSSDQRYESGHYYLIIRMEEKTTKICKKCEERYRFLHNNKKCKVKKITYEKERCSYDKVEIKEEYPLEYQEWVEKLFYKDIELEVLHDYDYDFINTCNSIYLQRTKEDRLYGTGSGSWIDSEKAWKEDWWGFIHAVVEFKERGILVRKGFSLELLENEGLNEWVVSPLDLCYKKCEGIFFSEYLHYLENRYGNESVKIIPIKKSRVWKNVCLVPPFPENANAVEFIIQNDEKYLELFSKIVRLDYEFFFSKCPLNCLKIFYFFPIPLHVDVASRYYKYIEDMDADEEEGVNTYNWFEKNFIKEVKSYGGNLKDLSSYILNESISNYYERQHYEDETKEQEPSVFNVEAFSHLVS